MNRQHSIDYREPIVKGWFGDDIDMNTINSVRNRRGLQNNFLSSTTDDYNANGQATPFAKKNCRYDIINDLTVISSLKSIIALNNNNNPVMKRLYFPPDSMELWSTHYDVDNSTYHVAPDSINVTCLMDAKRSFAAQFRQFDRGTPSRASLADDVPCGDVDCCFRVCVDEAQLNDQLQGQSWIPVQGLLVKVIASVLSHDPPEQRETRTMNFHHDTEEYDAITLVDAVEYIKDWNDVGASTSKPIGSYDGAVHGRTLLHAIRSKNIIVDDSTFHACHYIGTHPRGATIQTQDHTHHSVGGLTISHAKHHDLIDGNCYIISTTTTLMMPCVTIMHYYKLVSINDGGDVMRWYSTDDGPETIRMSHDGCDGCDAAMSHDGCDAMHATDWCNGNDGNLIDYGDVCELIEKQNKDNESGNWRVLTIVNHTTSKTSQERSKRLVKWESGETTLEPAHEFAIGCGYKWILAEYTRNKGLVDEWIDAKLLPYKNSPVYMLGHEVSHNQKRALRFGISFEAFVTNVSLPHLRCIPFGNEGTETIAWTSGTDDDLNINNRRGSLISTEREIIESAIGSMQITNRSLQWGAIRSDHHGSTYWKHSDGEFINTFEDEIRQRVYIKDYRILGTGFPSRSNEILCHFVGLAETAGHSMSFLVWNPATKRLLHRASLRAATNDDNNHPGNPTDDDDVDAEPRDGQENSTAIGNDDDGDPISTTMPPYYALYMTGTIGELQELAWMTLESIYLVSLVWNITLNISANGSWRTRIMSHTSGEIHISSDENGELRNDANYHYSISHFYSAGLDTFNIIVTYRFTDVKHCMTPDVDVSGIIIAHEVNAVAGYMDNGIYCNLGEDFSFASIIASSFNGLNVVDAYAPSLAHEYVGKAVIANAVWIGPCGDLMCTQVHYTFVWGELTCTKAYDTSVLIEPLHHGKDVSAMHSTQVNNSGVADSDGFLSNGGFIYSYSHNADLLDIVVPTSTDITDCDERLISVARDIYGLVNGARLIAIVERCLMCDADHVSRTEAFNRRPIYEEYRALSRYGKQSTNGVGTATNEINLDHDTTLDDAGRDVLSLVNGNCYDCDGLIIHIPDTPPVYEDTPTYGNATGLSNGEDVISGDLDAVTHVPEWGVLEGIQTKQQPQRYAGHLAAIETTNDTRDKRVIGIGGYHGLMNCDEHEPSRNDVVNSRHSWGATSTTFAAVNSDDSLLQVINEYNFESVNDCSGVLTMDTISRRRQPMIVLAADLGHAYMLCPLDSTDGSPCMILRLRPTCNIVCKTPMTTAPDTTMNVSASTGSAITAYADTNAIIYYDAPARDKRHLISTGSKQAHYVAGIEDCSMRQAVRVNDCVNHAMPAFLVEDTTRRYLLGPCDVYHSTLGDSILALILISAGSTLQGTTVGYIATDTKLNGMAVGTTELCAPRYYILDCPCAEIKSQNSTEATSGGESGSNVTTTSTTCLNSGASSRMNHPRLDSNEMTSPGLMDDMLKIDKAKLSLLWGAKPTRFVRHSHNESCSGNDGSNAVNVGSYTRYTCGDEWSLDMDEVAMPHDIGMDPPYFAIDNSADDHNVLGKSSSSYCAVLDARHTADNGFNHTTPHKYADFLYGDPSDVKDTQFDPGIYAIRITLERTRMKLVPSCRNAICQCRPTSVGYDESAAFENDRSLRGETMTMPTASIFTGKSNHDTFLVIEAPVVNTYDYLRKYSHMRLHHCMSNNIDSDTCNLAVTGVICSGSETRNLCWTYLRSAWLSLGSLFR